MPLPSGTHRPTNRGVSFSGAAWPTSGPAAAAAAAGTMPCPAGESAGALRVHAGTRTRANVTRVDTLRIDPRIVSRSAAGVEISCVDCGGRAMGRAPRDLLAVMAELLVRATEGRMSFDPNAP